MNSAFKEQVYAVVRSIPSGQVMTYGEVAAAAGNPKAARAVGAIMRGNPKSFVTAAGDPDAVPCHRVVAASRRLGGFNGGTDAKIALLTAEGWRIGADRTVAR